MAPDGHRLRGEAYELVKSTFAGWNNDKVPRLGAALAFYTVLSLAPMTVVILAVGGWILGNQAAQGQLVWQFQDLVGAQGARTIQSIIQDARQPAAGAIATTLGLIAVFFGATAVVNELRDDLNTIWGVSPNEHISGWRSLLAQVRYRLFSFAMVVGVAFFLLVSLTINAWLAAAGAFLSEVLPAPAPLIEFGNSCASFLVIAFVFAVLYKTLPAVEIEWSDVAVGALVTSALFTIGKSLIGFYLGKTGTANSYGAAGSLVIVLLWVYYSAQIFFLGAEFTCVYTRRYGSKFRRNLEPSPAPEQAPHVVVLEPIRSQKG